MSTNPVPPTIPSEEKAIVDAFTKFGEKAKLSFVKANRIKFTISREILIEVARFVKEALGFDHCTNVTGTDFPKDRQLEITFHFGSLDKPEYRRLILAVSCRIPSDDATLPSLIEIFPSANYHERETAEMIGCVFNGHPNLGRFLLPEDWNDMPPMLKAYRLPGRLEEG